MASYLQEEGMEGSQPDGDCSVWTHGSAGSQTASLPVVRLTRPRLGGWTVRDAATGRWTEREKEGGRQRSRWTHSAVICVTSGREVKPEPRKESRYWVIFSAASQSSTELKLLRSGAPRSNKGWWDGLQMEERVTAVFIPLRKNMFIFNVLVLTQGQCCWWRF